MTPGTILIIVSANAEWKGVLPLFPQVEIQIGPYGQWFETQVSGHPAIYLHGGWGKIAAAASAQYAIQRWQPRVVVNLGTCGGFAGSVQPGDVVLVDDTLVYDIIEQMGDDAEAIEHFHTRLDLSWLPQPYPHPVRVARLVSGDRDLLPEDIVRLQTDYGAVAGDWESGAIAWVAARNQLPCLILRGVTDLVSPQGGEAYGQLGLFQQRAAQLMAQLVRQLPDWIVE